jgi:hypothetical protein
MFHEIDDHDKWLTVSRKPSNGNQELAMDYRRRQLDVLNSALPLLSTRLTLAMSTSSFHQLSQHYFSPSKTETEPNTVELLSLECAFELLCLNSFDIYTAVVQMISTDQEEPLPLNWAVIVEDWDYTYWVVWLFIVCLISKRDEDAFKLRHDRLSSWLLNMNKSVFHYS